MGTRTRTTAERLETLLPWLNEERWDATEEATARLKTRLSRFLASFDGSEDAGHVRYVPPEDMATLRGRPAWVRASRAAWEGTEGIDDYEVLHTVLRDLLGRGFPKYEPIFPDIPVQFFVQLTSGLERRGKGQAGSYVWRVSGDPLELVPWLVMHLLTLPGAIQLKRCPAPAPHSRGECGAFFVKKRTGRTGTFCTNTCRQRNHFAPDDEVHRQRALAKRRARRKALLKRRNKKRPTTNKG
jgi:hypothetical protein